MNADKNDGKGKMEEGKWERQQAQATDAAGKREKRK
jgi:hypothetical protein